MSTKRRSRLPMRLLVALFVLLRLPLAGRRRRPREVRHILVLHHLLLGDALMLTPLLAKLRERYPDASVHVAMPKAFVTLYQHGPYRVLPVPFDPRDPATFFALLALPKPDLVLLPADNRYSWLARAIGGRWIVAFAGDRPAYKNWPVDEQRAYSSTPTAWGDTAAELVDGPRPAPYRVAQWTPPPAHEFALPPAPYAVLHVGASTPLKQWPPQRWRELAGWLDGQGIAPVWSAGAAELGQVAAIDPTQRYPSFAGRLDLAQLWRLLGGARLLVCPDTGVAHLGRIAGVPTVTLFGPGSALVCGAGDFWRDSPYVAVTVEDFPCRDQNIQFFRSIPWMRRCERLPPDCVDPKCMQAIMVVAVLAGIAALPCSEKDRA
ncbi:MAG: glycosyltransferase family 9 protein [Sterolibacterium sp.]